MEHPLGRALAAILRVDRRCVEAEHYHLDALQPEDAKGLRPAPVVADAHPEYAAQQGPSRKAKVAGLEIALFKVLVTALRIELVVPGQMDLAVFADDDPLLVDQYRGVEVTPIRRAFRIAETHGYGGALRLLKQRSGGGAWHLTLEPDIGFGAVLPVPAREEGCQRQLRIDDEVAALGLPHEIEHAGNRGLAGISPLDWTELGGGHFDVAHPIAP